MTDEQIVRALAEKVMGWYPALDSPVPDDGFFYTSDKKVIRFDPYREWNPLTSDAHACAVLDKMAEMGFMPTLGYSDTGEWSTEWMWANPRRHERGEKVFFRDEVVDPDRRRTICIAALKAIGAWEE